MKLKEKISRGVKVIGGDLVVLIDNLRQHHQSCPGLFPWKAEGIRFIKNAGLKEKKYRQI